LAGITATEIAAALVLAGYVLESVHWLVAAIHPPHREVVWIFVLPRLICSTLGLGAAYLLNRPWSEGILIAFVTMLLLETMTRIGLRRIARAAAQRAEAAIAAHDGKQLTNRRPVRTLGTVIVALLLVPIFSFTLWTYVMRETVFDARIWTRNLNDSGFYTTLIRAASDTALDAAYQQRGTARQVAELLTEDDIRLAEQWSFPEPWTTTWLQESLATTLAWLQTPGEQRVPPISIPVSDIERHAKDAASLLLDRHLAALPTCTSEMTSSAFCRPADMSVDAHTATFKLQNMAIADEILDQIPAELDLSTAVALFDRPFSRPLSYLAQARGLVQELDRGLALAGVLCLALLALLWLLCSITRKSRLRWLGVTLLATALLTWAASYAAYSLLPSRAFSPSGTDLPEKFSVPLQNLAYATLADVHNRVCIGALVSAGLGLLFLWAPLLAPHKEIWTRPATAVQTVRTGVVLLAILGVLWTVYSRAGARLYAQASQLYRDQDVAAANTRYRQLLRLYPFRISGTGPAGDFVDRARRDLHQSQLYLDAQTAHGATEWQTAVLYYEAFLLTQPALKLRDHAQAHLAEALIRWARALEADGKHERALDRYRFVRDEGLGRSRQLDGEPIRIHRMIGDLYLAWGDERLSQDPEAALATYRRALDDTEDPGVWQLAEGRMVDAYCAWNAQRLQAGQTERAAGICIELGIAFPALAPDPCAVCTP
jgi:hypothetical protein